MTRSTSDFHSVQVAQPTLRLICATVGILLWGSRSLLGQDPALLTCLSWIHDGAYPGGIAQEGCEAKFNLPDPFTITCLDRIEIGVWSDATGLAACHIHLTDLITRQYEDYLSEPDLLSLRNSGGEMTSKPLQRSDEKLVATEE